MNARVSLLLGAAATIAVGASVLSWDGAGADYFPAPATQKVTLDGERVEASVSTAPGTRLVVAGDLAGGPIRTEATGIGGAPVATAITGTPTFALPASTLSLLAGQRNCSYTPLGNPSVGSVPSPLPRASNQTGISITAHNFGTSVDYVSCWPETLDAGPLPNCANDGGVGYPIHSGGALALDLASNHRVFCLTCVHGGAPPTQTADLGGGVTSCIP